MREVKHAAGRQRRAAGEGRGVVCADGREAPDEHDPAGSGDDEGFEELAVGWALHALELEDADASCGTVAARGVARSSTRTTR